MKFHLRKEKSGIIGRWNILEMSAWDEEFIHMAGQAYIEFRDHNRSGEFGFGAVTGDLDYRLGERDGLPLVEWCWLGFDEGDPTCGRGWAVLQPDGNLAGEIFIHGGDESGFTACRAGRK